MRELNKQQKELLTEAFNDAPSDKKPFAVEDLNAKIVRGLVLSNDYETLMQDANRFISDMYFDWQAKQDRLSLRF